MKNTFLFTRLFRASLLLSLATGCKQEPVSISGIYPSLAYYNNEGECGTGAVVNWADKLWFVTYGPHLPYGSSDKLYSVNDKLELSIFPSSIGGTPANRMIHKESGQLFIGPYAINDKGDVRALSYQKTQGRFTGMARHLTDPENRIYLATMEEGFYDIDVNTLEAETLYKDANAFSGGNHDDHGINPEGSLLPGAHGKGLYSGQGVMVFSNNGEAVPEALVKFDIQAGVLAEWDGKDWTVIRRNQFVEVTGPGGIYGNNDPAANPIWATGWDHKSILVGVRGAQEGWQFYRLPKLSHSYDGAHGWNTEWPRIRNVGTESNPDYLMTMHGGFWQFPATFAVNNTKGIRSRSAYLKVIGDFCRWNDQLVFGCDDSAQKDFLNKRKVKGDLPGPGQSNSNLWFTSLQQPDMLGETTAQGKVWSSELVKQGEWSEPFLFAGWEHRGAWLHNQGDKEVRYTFAVDESGNNQWQEIKQVALKPNGSCYIEFPSQQKGEWIRVSPNQDSKTTLSFAYSESPRAASNTTIFDGIASIHDNSRTGALVRSLGDDKRTMGVLATQFTAGEQQITGYYELTADLKLQKTEEKAVVDQLTTQLFAPKNSLTIDAGSVLIVDDQNRRWRLPLGDKKFTNATLEGELRICREVSTERDLFNCHGTFYELPAENADGFAKIRPITSHQLRINDYASYRGLMVMTGLDPEKARKTDSEHIILSDDKQLAVWVGAIDDLWKLGKPKGQGGPWMSTQVSAGEFPDPYLFGFYDQRELSLSHNGDFKVSFRVEIDPSGDGDWIDYATLDVEPNEMVRHQFPEGINGRWIRLVADKAVAATAEFIYN